MLAISSRTRKFLSPHPGTILTFLISATLTLSGQTPTPEPTMVVLGQTIVRDIASGQKHAFAIRASAGQVVRGTVVQSGTDVIVRIFADKGRWTSEFDIQFRYEGKDPFEFVADETGSYRVEVEAKRGTPKGEYQLNVFEIQPAEERDIKAHKARVLMSAAAAQSRAGKFSDAIATAEEALKIREEVFGNNSVETAVVVNRIGIYNSSAGNDTKAFEGFSRALKIYESLSGVDEVLVTDVLNNIAADLRRQGRFAEAESNFKKVIAIREKAFGPDAYALGPTFNNFGLLYRVRGDLDSAEQYYTRSLAVREKHLSDDDLELQTPLVNLAALATIKGDFAVALKLDERVLSIRQKRLPAGHPGIAEATYNLALVHSKMGKLELGEKLILEAIQTYEKAYPPDSSQHFSNYSALGNIYRDLGQLGPARQYIDRALRVSKLNLKNDPLTHGKGLLYSARLRLLQNDLIIAEQELTEALAIHESILGPDHIDTHAVLSTFAKLYAKNGKVPAAIESQARANAIGDRQLAVNLVFGTEQQRLDFATMLSTDLEQTLAMHAYLAPSDPKLRDLAANALLQRKGRVLDATALSMSAMRRHVSPENSELLSQINDTTARLSALMLTGARSGGLEAYQKSLNELYTLKDSLDRELSRRSAGYYQPQKTYTIEQAKALLPANSALVEFTRVDPAFAPGSKVGAKPEYVAYVIRPTSDVEFVRLGEASRIDAAAAGFRKAVRDPNRTDVKTLGGQLDKLVLAPLRSVIGPATHILLSPEGELSTFPFEALVDQSGSFAVQKFQFTYVTSGRDLFRLRDSPQETEGSVIVADPSFGTDDRTPITAAGTSALGESTRSVTTGKDMSDVFFGPLRGTAAEARYIKQLFPDARLLTGSDATVSAVKKLRAPRLLHLATHGFFLESQPADTGGADKDRILSVSPLVRSGLAFAGANLRNGGTEDGVLTALEAAGLDLWGTKLTVLSACDTGVGEVRAGEGVYGLRRAFTLAGTQTLLMSLWPVGDNVTQELMSKYYLNLRNGKGRGEALRDVRLDLLKQRNRRHPYYWASFIQSGEWANLDGKR